MAVIPASLVAVSCRVARGEASNPLPSTTFRVS